MSEKLSLEEKIDKMQNEIDNLNVIEVKNFDQLLDIEEEIRMPILFYETIPDEQGEFIIVCDNMAYRYVIG